jgi:hypothetical protein
VIWFNEMMRFACLITCAGCHMVSGDCSSVIRLRGRSNMWCCTVRGSGIGEGKARGGGWGI